MNETDQNLTEEISSIKPISNDTVHKICSGQVVLSLAVAVKELVENSLDAGATTVDVKVKNYGTELIEVSDNGSGVTEENFNALTLKYHTSKLCNYSDLLGVSSYGFRGEALSSLCSLSNVTITTRHQNSSHATKIVYDYKGNIISRTPCSRQVGTTVSVSNLFCSLPVRQKEFHKNAKREFTKMTNLLYAYCLISSGVKITCSNVTSTKTLVVATQGSSSFKDNIACVFGIKQLQSLLEIKTESVSNIKDNILRGLSGNIKESEESVNIEDIEIDLSEDSNDAENPETISQETPQSPSSKGYKNLPNPVKLCGFISSCAHGSGRSTTDRQYFYINSRPCEPMKVIKVVNEIYRQFNPNQYPFVFLNIVLDKVSVDVNVTPDKRKVFIAKEKNVLDVVKTSLLKLFDNIPKTLKLESFDHNNTGQKLDKLQPELNHPRIFNSFISKFSLRPTKNSSNLNQTLYNKKSDLKRKSTTLIDSYVFAKKSNQHDISKEEINIENKKESTNDKVEQINMEHEIADETDEKFKNNKNLAKDTDNLNNIMYLEYSDDLPKTQIRNISDVIEDSHTISCKTKVPREKSQKRQITDNADLGKCKKKTVNLKTSFEHVQALFKIYTNKKEKSKPHHIKFRNAINPVFNKKCEEELCKEISSDSFKKMIIVGQFNLGFIITRLDDDLFIIDQHATDEIYNFETLQKTVELTSQKLVIPQKLELTGVNEQVLMDNLDVLKRNGFTFEIDKNALPTQRVKLLTVPMSKNWVFGKDDIEELLFMLRENYHEHCRPSRVRAMFASRACRKSVMIGTALSKADMKKLVDHMSEIDKPWNCPHGRPTIRHLVNLAMLEIKDD